MQLRTEDVALPEYGVAVTVDIQPSLPPEYRHLFDGPDSGLIPSELESVTEQREAARIAVDTKRAFGVTESEYPKLVARMLGIGMVRVSKTPPVVINGLFGVPKP